MIMNTFIINSYIQIEKQLFSTFVIFILNHYFLERLQENINWEYEEECNQKPWFVNIENCQTICREHYYVLIEQDTTSLNQYQSINSMLCKVYHDLYIFEIHLIQAKTAV